MLPILLGLGSSACLIASSLSLKRLRILILGLFINVLTGLQYMLLDQMGALTLTCLGFVLTAIVLASLKWPALGTTKVLGAFLVAYPVAFFLTAGTITSAVSLLPLFSMMVATTALFMKNLIVVKAMFIANGISWLIFEISAGAFGAVPGEIITLAGNTLSLVLLVLAYRANIPLDAVPELNMRIATAWNHFQGRGNRLGDSMALPTKGFETPVVVEASASDGDKVPA